jgi:hypothetical protein
MTQFYELALGILVTWRMTHLFAIESGPGNIFANLRRAAGTGIVFELLSCFYCLSLWIAIPLALILATGWRLRLLLWPALSAGAILLERIASRSEPTPPIFMEDQEGPNVLRS